jgi:hypothetical protein
MVDGMPRRAVFGDEPEGVGCSDPNPAIEAPRLDLEAGRQRDLTAGGHRNRKGGGRQAGSTLGDERSQRRSTRADPSRALGAVAATVG